MSRVPGRADRPGPGDTGPAGVAAAGSRGSSGYASSVTSVPETVRTSPGASARLTVGPVCPRPAQPCTPRPSLCFVHKHPGLGVGNLQAGFVFPKTMPFFFLKAPLHTQVGKVSRGRQRGLEEMGDHSPASLRYPHGPEGPPASPCPARCLPATQHRGSE